MSIWYWVFGIIGAAQRFCANASSRRRYLADASYWVYVIHLPVVFGLQVLVMDWPLSLGLDAKAMVLLMLTLIVTTLSLGTGRTTVLQGVVHLLIFAVYLFTTVVP